MSFAFHEVLAQRDIQSGQLGREGRDQVGIEEMDFSEKWNLRSAINSRFTTCCCSVAGSVRNKTTFRSGKAVLTSTGSSLDELGDW